jgi:archaellum component FlaF (FlaF/FlaG flagellin family)
MGFSTAVMMAILFTSVIFLFATFYHVVNLSFDEYWTVFDEKRDRDESYDATELAITLVQYDKFTNNLTVVVQNAGDTTLNPNYINVLIDGEPVPDVRVNTTVRGVNTSIWLPTENLLINITSADLVYDPDIDPRIQSIISTSLTLPENISVGANRIYIVDGKTHIDVFTRYGSFVTTILDAVVTAPWDLAVGAEYLYVINGTNSVYRFNLDGSGRTPLIPNSELQMPTAIAVTPQFIYIVNNTNSIYRFNLDGSGKTELVPESSNYVPTDIYVTDYIYIINNSQSIVRFDLNGQNPVELIPNGGPLLNPNSIAVSDEDFTNQYIYIIDDANHLDVYEIDGTYNSTISDGLSSNLYGVDVQGRIYITDQSNGLVIMNIGTSLKITVENGAAEHLMI